MKLTKRRLKEIISEEINGLLVENNESLQPLEVTVDGNSYTLVGGRFPLMGKMRYDLRLVAQDGEAVQSKGGFDVNKILRDLGLDASKIKLVFTVDKPEPKKKGEQ